MRKRLLLLAMVVMLMTVCLGITACESETERNDHVHTYSDEWTSDETHHWHAATCEHSEEKRDVAEHVYDRQYMSDAYKAGEADCDVKVCYYFSCECGAKGTTTFESDTFGHAFGEVTYIWAENNATCTARRICAKDATHVEEEVANSVSSVVQAQSCTDDELVTFTATFENTAFVAQTKENVKTADKLSHSFTSYDVYENATCTDDATEMAKCDRCDETDIKTIENTRLGHHYGEITYTWAEDYTTCTAKRVCSRDATHVHEEVANSVSSVVQAQSCTDDELTTFTAIFKDAVFATQTKENVKTVDRLNHRFDATEYNYETTTYTCSECGEVSVPAGTEEHPYLVKDDATLYDILTNKGGYVRFVADIVGGGEIKIRKVVNIDLDGYTLSYHQTENKHNNNRRNWTILNFFQGSAGSVVRNGRTKYTVAENVTGNVTARTIAVNDDVKLLIEDMYMESAPCAVIVMDNSQTTINNCEIISGFDALKAIQYGPSSKKLLLEINNSKVVSTGLMGILAHNAYLTVNIKGSEIIGYTSAMCVKIGNITVDETSKLHSTRADFLYRKTNSQLTTDIGYSSYDGSAIVLITNYVYCPSGTIKSSFFIRAKRGKSAKRSALTFTVSDLRRTRPNTVTLRR